MHILVVGTEDAQGRGRYEETSPWTQSAAGVFDVVWHWFVGLLSVAGKTGDYRSRCSAHSVWTL